MKKIFLILCIAVCLCACGSAADTADKSNTADTAAISFVDDEGRQISMDEPAHRIISMYSAHTENLYYLGAGDSVIGGYKTCTYPPEAAFLDKYDYSGDPEAVIAANPDLVLIRPFITKKAPDYVKAIENAGITVVSLYPDKFDEFKDYINKLAKLTGTEDNAERLLADFYGQIDDISAMTKNAGEKQKIFFESTETNVRTVTADSMAGLAIQFAGGENIAADAQPIEDGSSIAEFGAEKVLENADNIDVYVSQRGSMNSGANQQSISERAGFDTVKAIKDGRFYNINEKLISSPTFRYVKGVRELARYLYPDIMDDISEYENDNAATRASFADIVFKAMHLQVYVPSSSSYYSSEHTHYFGMFKDVSWLDDDFDSIEACVDGGYIEGFKEGNDEYFYPENPVTRDELAQTIFVLGDFKAADENINIADLDESEHKRIVQILVDNGVFELYDGKFEPKREASNNDIITALKAVSD